MNSSTSRRKTFSFAHKDGDEHLACDGEVERKGWSRSSKSSKRTVWVLHLPIVRKLEQPFPGRQRQSSGISRWKHSAVTALYFDIPVSHAYAPVRAKRNELLPSSSQDWMIGAQKSPYRSWQSVRGLSEVSSLETIEIGYTLRSFSLGRTESLLTKGRGGSRPKGN